MIIGNDREQVIANIKKAANQRNFSAKVEIGDPVMTLTERKKLVENFWQKQNKWSTKFNCYLGHFLLNAFTYTLSSSTKIVGLKNLVGLPTGGAIITSNHYNQLDALPMKLLANKMHHQLSIVIEDTNLVLPGYLRYLMNNVGTIPLFNSPNYLGNEFLTHLQENFAQNRWVLIYPEQEMWWNYRKPRPLHRGAYYFAAKQNVPIISTFVEIQSENKLERKQPHFYKTKYIIHILKPIYPALKTNINISSHKMMQQDYQQKVSAFQKIYHKQLNYNFTPWDIAGWKI